MRPSFYHHLHPPTIPAQQARWRYTLGAGGISVFLTLVVGLTGVLEMFYYIPTPEKAALSIQMLTYLVPYGSLLRSLHYWAAQLLVLTTAVHLLRVVLTGAYAKPRRFNYLLGIVLLVLVFLLDFTGYILRWDEGIRWALVAGTNLIDSIPFLGANLYNILVGGNQLGAATLIRFYTWHIFGLALFFAFFGGWHLFRVRRDGGIAAPPPHSRRDASRITRFELSRREGLAMLWSLAFLVTLSLIRPAPLAPPLQEGVLSSSDGRAPWFFLWVQQLLKLGDPFLWGIVAPVMLLAIMAIIPYTLASPTPEESGGWFPRGGRLAQVTIAVISLVILALTILMLLPSGTA